MKTPFLHRFSSKKVRLMQKGKKKAPAIAEALKRFSQEVKLFILSLIK